ncbi:GSCOCG00012513001-RA-CDS, partial [Cotesia congregata]
MELLDDELDASDDGSNDEDILEAGVNNDDHCDGYDDDNVTENEDDNDNEDDPNYEDNNRNRQHNNIHQQQPLYNGSHITVGDSMLIILSFLLRHNLTMVCIEDIIKAIELHCLQDGLKK